MLTSLRQSQTTLSLEDTSPLITSWLLTKPQNVLMCFCQIGKEHLGLKAITEVLQDLQYKVGSKLKRSEQIRWYYVATDEKMLHIRWIITLWNWTHDDNYCIAVVFPSGKEQDNSLLQPQHSVTRWAENNLVSNKLIHNEYVKLSHTLM